MHGGVCDVDSSLTIGRSAPITLDELHHRNRRELNQAGMGHVVLAGDIQRGLAPANPNDQPPK
jgi:hypothetical protein